MQLSEFKDNRVHSPKALEPTIVCPICHTNFEDFEIFDAHIWKMWLAFAEVPHFICEETECVLPDDLYFYIRALFDNSGPIKSTVIPLMILIMNFYFPFILWELVK